MKKVLVVAAALTFAAGAASAGSWGGFSSWGGWSSWGNSHVSSHRGSSSSRWNRGPIIRIVQHIRSGGCLIFCSTRPPVTHPGGGGGTSNVPVPAAGILLVAGLGGFAAMKRRKKA